MCEFILTMYPPKYLGRYLIGNLAAGLLRMDTYIGYRKLGFTLSMLIDVGVHSPLPPRAANHVNNNTTDASAWRILKLSHVCFVSTCLHLDRTREITAAQKGARSAPLQC